jgi:adenosylhomocysteinase
MNVNLDHEAKIVTAFFSNLLTELGTKTATDTVAVCVAHVLSTAEPFLTALNRVLPVAVLAPKPKSQHRATVRAVKKSLDCIIMELDREPELLDRLMEALARARVLRKSIVLVDIGGYFAPILDELKERIERAGGKLVGVMEGTENGAQEYERIFKGQPDTSVPVVTVARSPLKLPEDHLVGAGIVFSIESILRKHNQILQSRNACVIGFGRVGSAVASALRGRGIPTIINDKYPVKLAEAAAQGYQVYPNIHDAVARSTLIVSATSAHALDKYVLASVRSGAAIATVTSKDTEFADEGAVLAHHYDPTALIPSNDSGKGENYVVRYDEQGASTRYFWLLNDGNAPNFVDGAVLGPALQLIEGEKIAAVAALTRADSGAPLRNSLLREISETDRDVVASVWNGHFISI